MKIFKVMYKPNLSGVSEAFIIARTMEQVVDILRQNYVARGANPDIKMVFEPTQIADIKEFPMESAGVLAFNKRKR